MSSSLKTRGEGGKKQQNRNFHEVEFQRLLLITGTSLSRSLSLALALSASPAAIGFHNLKKAHAALLLPSPRCCCCFSRLARPVTRKKIIMTTNDRLKQGRASVKKIQNKKIIKIARLELKMTAEAARAPGRSLSLSCASWNRRIGSVRCGDEMTQNTHSSCRLLEEEAKAAWCLHPPPCTFFFFFWNRLLAGSCPPPCAQWQAVS